MVNDLMNGAIISRASSVLYNDFDDGLMMMDIDSGNYFDVDSVGARVWTLLEKPMSLDQICAALASEYDVERDLCLKQTAEFIAFLGEKHLVQLDGES